MVYERIPWTDPFNRPTPQQLRRCLPPETAAAFDDARSHIRGMGEIKEGVAWYGDSWRWSLEYRLGRSSEPLAVLIPSPEDLQLAMPLAPTFLDTLPMTRMRRAVRDGLDLAQEPFDTHWGVWSIQPGTMLEDLEDLVSRKFRHEREAG